MSARLTDWIPIATPPVREGIYNVSCRYYEQTGIWYAYWNGKQFGYYVMRESWPPKPLSGSVDDCTKSWRGLAADSKGKQ